MPTPGLAGMHRPDLKADSAATEQSYAVGDAVGEVARKIYDPEGRSAVTLDFASTKFPQVFVATQNAMRDGCTIFEAAFEIPGALALADVLIPQGRHWRMVEVKSSTRVKDAHRDDIAIQTHIVTQSGVPLRSVALAHVDSAWVYRRRR